MTQPVLGFIGLGVMGEPICRNIMTGSGGPMIVSDLATAPIQRLVSQGAVEARPEALAEQADIIFLSLPGGPEVETVVSMLLPTLREGQILVDMSTAPVALTRDLAARVAARGCAYADAPVARTRAAAEAGTLAIMVGADDATYDTLLPLLSHAGEDVLHCGPVGCGQIAKILNNMVLFQNVVALSEALALGRAAGMEGERLFQVLSQGSADSFALRNHGMKAMLPDTYPEQAFPTGYALKDVGYALELARDSGLSAPGAELARARMDLAREAGFEREYFPVLARLAGRDSV
ncbi:NAD(P)-dependent oxidoreductase [Pseudooceanicola sp. C21-150M6]|uniref:NAD(P)-dependent oxidoreductase n=1 Tax=Pseudooceanicola sp. C21-150M6 TaxID=3434355 RepID=UPI003D800115